MRSLDRNRNRPCRPRHAGLHANRKDTPVVTEHPVENVGDALGIVSASVQSSVTNFKRYIEERRTADGGWRGEVRDGVVESRSRPAGEPAARTAPPKIGG